MFSFKKKKKTFLLYVNLNYFARRIKVNFILLTHLTQLIYNSSLHILQINVYTTEVSKHIPNSWKPTKIPLIVLSLKYNPTFYVIWSTRRQLKLCSFYTAIYFVLLSWCHDYIKEVSDSMG